MWGESCSTLFKLKKSKHTQCNEVKHHLYGRDYDSHDFEVPSITVRIFAWGIIRRWDREEFEVREYHIQVRSVSIRRMKARMSRFFLKDTELSQFQRVLDNQVSEGPWLSCRSVLFLLSILLYTVEELSVLLLLREKSN